MTGICRSDKKTGGVVGLVYVACDQLNTALRADTLSSAVPTLSTPLDSANTELQTILDVLDVQIDQTRQKLQALKEFTATTSMAAGAAIGTMIGGPLGTVIGGAAGLVFGALLDHEWSGGKSATTWAKDGIKNLFGW